MSGTPRPHAHYEERREEHARRREEHERRAEGARRVRTAGGLLLIAYLFAALALPGLPAYGAFLFALVFAAAAASQAREERRARGSARRETWNEEGLARLEGRWAGRGEGGTAFAPRDHLYARDLDLFGEGSVFELLCRARTGAGRRTLASWLTAPAPLDAVRERQGALQELRDRTRLREDLAVLGEEAAGSVRPDLLDRWAGHARIFSPPLQAALTVLAFTLPALLLAGLVLWTTGPMARVSVLMAAGGELLLYLGWGERAGAPSGSFQVAGSELDLLARLLERIGSERASGTLLAGIRRRLGEGDRPPSRALLRLHRLHRASLWERNLLFAPVAAGLLWRFHFGLALERWRARHGPQVPLWMDAAGRFEALCSLSAHAFEHPGDPFPDLQEEGPLFHAAALGHPLLTEEECVRNDVRLGEGERIWVVSGSNMSGKSTLLRSVGVNAVLARAGAPVRAASLRISPLQVGATIHIEDSLQAGHSRFFEEITRIRRIVEAAESGQVLFLLDELLHGTNSSDRAQGARVILENLAARGAVGLVTTHDLALARLAEDGEGPYRNVHFEDRMEEGRPVFDYRLKPGPVRRGNALDLMRSIGFDVA
ncbi:MAG: DNA mismatch repair protein MutS [bacterium]